MSAAVSTGEGYVAGECLDLFVINAIISSIVAAGSNLPMTLFLPWTLPWNSIKAGVPETPRREARL